MNLAQIRTDLKTRADTIAGLTCYDRIPYQIEPPAFVVGPFRRVFNARFGPTGTALEFTCRVYVELGDELEGQLLLDTYCEPTGATSIKSKLDDLTLGNTASLDWTNVREVTSGDVFEFGGTAYLGAEFAVEVPG